MTTYIINQWKKKKITVALIIFGFVVANIFMSVGTSVSVNSYNYIQDINSGNPKEQLMLEIDLPEISSSDTFKKFVDYIGEFGEVQIISLDSLKLDENVVAAVVPVSEKKIKGWHIPIKEGEYLRNNKDEIVVGKILAEQLGIKVGEELQLGDKTFYVVGICGRDEYDTNWDNCIYMDVNMYFDSNLFSENLKGKSIYYAVLKTGKDEFMDNFDDISSFAKECGIDVYYQDVKYEVSSDSFGNSVLITVLSTSLVFVIAIINIINLMFYWMLERTKDLAIMKAMGATNKYLIKWTMFEMSSIAVIGAVIALVIQLVGNNIFFKLGIFTEDYLQISYLNILFAVIISIVCGTLTALLVSKKTFTFNLSQVLASE